MPNLDKPGNVAQEIYMPVVTNAQAGPRPMAAKVPDAKRIGRPLELPEIRLNNRPPERTPAATSLLDLLRRRFGILGSDEPL